MSEIPSWRNQAISTLRELESQFLQPAPINTERTERLVIKAKRVIGQEQSPQNQPPPRELSESLSQEFENFGYDVSLPDYHETDLTEVAWQKTTTLILVTGSALQCIQQWNQSLSTQSIVERLRETAHSMESQPVDAGWQAVTCCRAVATMGTQLVDTNDILAGLNGYSFPHPDQSFEDVRACLLEAVEQGNRQAFDVIKAKLSEAKNWEWTNEHIDTFTHRDFEFLIADLWATYGYETNVTQGKRDAGRDVECRADGETVFIEVKQHSGKVGSKVCQQAAGLYKEHDLEEVVLLTSSGFTQPAIDRATQNDVRLIAGGELRERLNSSPLVPPLGFL